MASILAMEIAGSGGGAGRAAAAGGGRTGLGAAVVVVFAFFAAAGATLFGIVALTAVLQAGDNLPRWRCMHWGASAPPAGTLPQFAM